MIVPKTIAFPFGYIPDCVSYQLAFLNPETNPKRINFKKTYLENNVSLWYFFLFSVKTHFEERETDELLLVNEFKIKKAFHLIVFEKFKFLNIDFNTKFCLFVNFKNLRSFLSFSIIFFIFNFQYNLPKEKKTQKFYILEIILISHKQLCFL